MIYVVHTYYNGETVHTHKYMTFEEAFVDYNSYTLSGLKEGTPYRYKKALYIKERNCYFQYLGPVYFPPEKWDGVDRRST
jgi:hypothetical protein